jgi:hypothetical protein
MRRYSSLIVQVCCCLFVLISAGSAFAATVAVGTCQPGKVSFDSHDDAVNGVPDGSTILVCPGIYQEQIVINRSHHEGGRQREHFSGGDCASAGRTDGEPVQLVRAYIFTLRRNTTRSASDH